MVDVIEENGAAAPVDRRRKVERVTRSTRGRRVRGTRRRPGQVTSAALAALLGLTASWAAGPGEAQPVSAPASLRGSVDVAAAAPTDAPASSPVEQPVVATPAPAVLAGGPITVSLADGVAALQVDRSTAPVELATTSIGDLDLTSIEPIASSSGTEVSFDWGDVTEWYRQSGEGVEHGYTVEGPVAAGSELVVRVDVGAGHPALVDGQTVLIERPNGSDLWYRGLFAFDADGTDLPASMRVVDAAIELRVDTAGAVYPITIDPVITEDQKVSTGETGLLGYDVDVDGNRMVASAPFSDLAATDAGAVNVYERVDSSSPWVLTTTIVSPDPAPGAGFGDSVAVNGDFLVVGESDRLGGLDEPGRVFVFLAAGGTTWEEIGPTGGYTVGTTGDGFGTSVAWIDEDDFVVGAPQATAGDSTSGGGLYRINIEGFLFDITPTGGLVATGDLLGASVAAGERPGSGSWVVAGAPGTESSGGAVHLMQLDIDMSVVGNTKYSGYAPGSNAGSAVDVDGNRAVSAGYGDGTTPLRLDVFEYGAGGWNADTVRTAASGPDPADPPNRYVDIDGGTIAIGDGGAGGRVALFQYTGSELSVNPIDTFEPVGRVPGDRVGRSVALDGPTLIAGAPGDTTNAGAVYSATVTEIAAPQAPIVVDSLLDTVADDGLCTLREAITAADTDTAANGCAAGSGADTIVFAVSGTIPLAPALSSTLVAGAITTDITIDGVDTDIVLDGQGATSVLRVNAGGAVTLANLTVANGRQQGCDGGDTCGAVLNYGTLRVRNSTFSANQTLGLGNGAAITNRGGGNLTVDRTTFVDNLSGNAGAIWNASDASGTLTTAVVTNSTFVNNGSGGAGAIYNTFNASLTVRNSTFVDTTGPSTIRNAGGAAPVVLENTIVTKAGSAACDGPDPFIADSFNLDTDGTCDSASTASLAQLDLGPLADNGGPTQTVALGDSSVAIGAGDETVCSAGPVNGVDQRGAVRPIDSGCDSGASEYVGLCTATWTGGGENGVFTDFRNWIPDVPTVNDIACIGGTPGDIVFIPSGAAVDVAGFGSMNQSLVVDGTLDIEEASTLDGPVTVNGAFNTVGGVKLTTGGTIDGTITGPIMIDTGAIVDILGGTITGATTTLTNLGDVVVTGPNFLFGDSATIENTGTWTWDSDGAQEVQLADPFTSSFENVGTVEKARAR